MYFIKRHIRSWIRFFKWLPVIWKDYDYDYMSVVDVLIFKLNDLAEGLAYYNNKPSSKRNVRRIKEIIGHFERYKNPPGEMIIEGADYTWEELPSGNRRLVDISMKYKPGTLFPEHQLHSSSQLEQWHWEEAWRKLAHYGQSFWD